MTGEGESAHDKQRSWGIIERNHRVGRQRETQVGDHSLSRVNGPRVDENGKQPYYRGELTTSLYLARIHQCT